MKRQARGAMILFFCAGLLLGCFSTAVHADTVSVLSEGTYFSVYGYPGLTSDMVAQRLQLAATLQIDDVLGPSEKATTMLAQMLDGLYASVSDIMDIHTYSFHGSIRIVPNKTAISSAFREVFGRDFPERSFYLPDTNTIYISFEDLTLGMLGHEIAHAIINRYFVVPPPTKVQEILCGYVEYSLRKSASTVY